MRTKRRTTLGAELRKRFKSPREALRRLGIDARILQRRTLAYDVAGTDPESSTAKAKLDDHLAGRLSGFELQRARDLMHGLDDEREDVEIEVEEAEDRVIRRVRPVRDKVLDQMRERFPDLTEDDLAELVETGLLDDAISDAWRTRDELRRERGNGRDYAPFPKNALHEGFGGRLHAEEARDRRDTWGGSLNSRSPQEIQRRLADWEAARDRKFARDQKSRAAFDEMFPEAARLNGTPLEAGLESPDQRYLRTYRSTARRVAGDRRSRDDGDPFGMARIGFA